MDLKNVVYTHNRVFFSLQKEGNSDIGYNIDEPFRDIMLNEISQS